MSSTMRQWHGWFVRERRVHPLIVLADAAIGAYAWVHLVRAVPGWPDGWASDLMIAATIGLSVVSVFSLQKWARLQGVSRWQFAVWYLNGKPLPLSPQTALLWPFAMLALCLVILLAVEYWPITLILLFVRWLDK